ncbi:MAG: PaaI family thioesterase [Candidatus Woesearchaeota archaeon]
MGTAQDLLAELRAFNQTSAFNRSFGFTVESVRPGEAELSMPWREEAGQYSGFLHAGLVGALIDTACGYAAATVAGPNLLAAHYSVNCLRPAIGSRFVARARVVKPGKQQVFTSCQLFAQSAAGEVMVATGETLLSVVAQRAEA